MAQKPDLGLDYARAAVRGDIVAGKLVRLACQRHLRELKQYGTTKGRAKFWFDERDAARALEFIEKFCHHSKGEWAGTLVILEGWQRFCVASLFGWKRKDGTRRYRKGYIQIARKNGKSTLAAAVGLLLLVGDGEPGAEVYAAATKRDQAEIIWSEADRMVKKSPSLLKLVTPLRNNLSVTTTSSKFEPLSAEANTLDGLNPHGILVDELHAHRTREVYDVLDTGTGARRQPMLISFTTAGSDRKSVCWEEREYARKVLEGHLEDETFFAYVAELDKDDDWTDEKGWMKANPNLGVSVKIDDLRRQAAKAKNSPPAQNTFRRLRLDQWTEQVTRWIDLAVWDACAGAVDETSLRGRPCYVGLDLSSTRDITAAVAIFPPVEEEPGEPWEVLCKFFIPADNVAQRVRDDGVPFDVWIEQGHVDGTPGNVVDQDFVKQALLDWQEEYEIREVPYDPYNSTKLATELQSEGLVVVPFRQGFVSMSPAMKELERMVLTTRIAHGGNPVLRWMVGNVAVIQDPAGNMKAAKDKSSDRIDGVVALIMAVGRASVHVEAGASTYETNEVFVI